MIERKKKAAHHNSKTRLREPSWPFSWTTSATVGLGIVTVFCVAPRGKSRISNSRVLNGTGQKWQESTIIRPIPSLRSASELERQSM